MLKAINIKWDTDGDMEVLNELPTELIIPDDLEELYKRKAQEKLVSQEYEIENLRIKAAMYQAYFFRNSTLAKN